MCSRLTESDKECGGWIACTEVKPQPLNRIAQSKLLLGMFMARPAALHFLPPPSGLSAQTSLSRVGRRRGRGAPSLSLKLHSPFYPWLNPLSLSATCFPLPFLPPDVPSISLVDLSIICPLPPSCEPHSAGIFTCLVCCCTPSTSS